MRKRPNFSRFDARGVTAELCKNISDRWLKGIAETNPAILTMFQDRDAKPYRDLLAWSGEFAGKYLTSAYFVYLETGDEALKEYVIGFIDRLLARQDEDGYLGCYSRETRFTALCRRRPTSVPGHGTAGRTIISCTGFCSGTKKRGTRDISKPWSAWRPC